MKTVLPSVALALTMLVAGSAGARRLAVVPLPPSGVDGRVASARHEEIAAALSRRGWQVVEPEAAADRVFEQGPRWRRLQAERERFAHLVTQGAAQLKQLRLAAAVAALGRAVELMREVGPWAKGPRQLARVHFLLGVALHTKQETDLAQASFTHAAALAPRFEPSPTEFPPEIVQQFRIAREALARARRCPFALGSSPAGATARVDGTPAGVTPLKVRLTPGPHYLLVTRAGHAPVARVVNCGGAETLQAGRVDTLHLTLPPRPKLPPPSRLASEVLRGTSPHLGSMMTTLDVDAVVVVRAGARGKRDVLRFNACHRAPLLCEGGELELQPRAVAPASPVAEALSRTESGAPWYTRWWFWSSVAAVVVTAAVVVPVSLHTPSTRYEVRGD